MLVQTDCGTDNGILAVLQCFLSGETVAHSCSFAHANQHMQGWWSHSKRHFTAWAIDFLRNSLKLALGNHLLMECVWFVFSDFLQLDLDKVKHEWNSHFIRQYRHCTVPGIPSELYYTHGFDHFWLNLSADDVENVPDQRDIYNEAQIAKEIDDDPFRPYFHCCSRSGHYCEDHFHSRLYPQFKYMTFIYS